MPVLRLPVRHPTLKPLAALLRGSGRCLLGAALCLSLVAPVHAETHKHHKATHKTAPKKSAPAKKTTRHGSRKPLTGDLQKQAQSAQSDLANVQQRIQSAQQTIKLTEAQRAAKEAELKEAEVQIGGLKKELHATTSEAEQRQQALAELNAEQQQHEADKQRQLGQLQKDVQLSYQRGNDDYFKLLLNQQQPEKLARQLKYYAFIQKARTDRIHELDKTLQELARIETEQKGQLEKLGVLKNTLQQQQTSLAQAQQTREKAIQVLSSQIDTQDEQLKRLLRDQTALQSLMQRLEQQAREEAKREQEREAARKAEQERLAREKEKAAQQQANRKPVETAPQKPAEKPAEKPADEHWSSEPDYVGTPSNGRCALPVSGGIRSQFGAARAGGLRWNGVLIAAASGTPVRAVKAGRVVYADYLRGYGFLIIIDHGHGLMSLYGQNQSLLKTVGDNVNANESVALVGSSGGNSSPGLYFEIRVRGRPSNPVAWCGY